MGRNMPMFKQFMHFFVASLILFHAGTKTAHAESIKIVGFGDSLMAGYELPNGEGFTDQLQARLQKEGFDVTVANAGVSGDTTSGGLGRLDWSVPDGTDLVILELGANDALRGISPDITRANLDAMIGKLKDRSIAVILAGMLAPPNMGEAYAADYNPIFSDLATKYDIPLYPFFLDGVMAVPGTQLPDGMHPNATGVQVMVERFMPLITTWLEANMAQ